MRRFLIAFVSVVAVITVGASFARAAILPTCDQTVYTVKDPNAASDVICDPNDATNKLNCKSFTPEQYDALDADFKRDNPPIVTVNKACGFNDFVQLFINLSNWGLGILAVLALGFTVWGGFTLLLSGGNSEKVQEGKKTIWGGILGVTIVLTSWIFVGFVISALTGTGFTLFQGTPYERTFFGAGECGKDFKSCTGDLKLYCQDTDGNADAVSKAQGVLSILNCYNLGVDGCFGPGTEEAVKRFQRANSGCRVTLGATQYSLPDYNIGGSPDGVINDEVKAFLNAASQNIPIECPPFIPGNISPVGTCTGNGNVICTDDSECAAIGFGTCNNDEPPVGRCSGDPTYNCDPDNNGNLTCSALGAGTCEPYVPSGATETVRKC